MQISATASGAYGAAQGLKNSTMQELSALKPTKVDSASASQGFGQLVDAALVKMENQVVATDKQAVSLAKGEADIVDVVTAVAETELALETLVSVRDRVVTAYEEIMRMPI